MKISVSFLCWSCVFWAFTKRKGLQKDKIRYDEGLLSFIPRFLFLYYYFFILLLFFILRQLRLPSYNKQTTRINSFTLRMAMIVRAGPIRVNGINYDLGHVIWKRS